MAKKNGRKWLLSVCAVPVAFAGVATADPWLEKSPTAGQGWDDIPFLGPTQRSTKQRQPRSQETKRALEAARELQRELHRLPETDRTANPKSAVNVFPPPRLPQQARTAPPIPSATAPPVEVRNTKISGLPHKLPRTAAVRNRDNEQELQRELNRTLPPIGVPPVGEPLACAERLAKIARYSPLPSRAGPGACGATDLVRLDGIVMPDRTLVALNPAPQIKCSMAEQLAAWVREDVGPAAAAELGSPLLSISDNDAYDCRPRNGIKGAPLSEHGKGNALDITGLRLHNGGVFTLADQLVAKSFRDKVRLSACGRFMTVLGPGADAYHGDHVHLDMAERTRKFKVCQWNVRETVVASRAEPEPQQAPASAPPVATVPVVPPPPKLEAKIEPKIDSQAQAAANPVEPPTAAGAAAPPASPPNVEPPAAPEPPPAAVEAPKEQAKEPQPEEALSQAPATQQPATQEQAGPEQPKEEQSPKRDTPTFDVAAAPPKEPEARQEQNEEASPPQTADTEQPPIPSPPLPRRKPEALQTLAELQQSETETRTEHDSRSERPRYYNSRRRFEREIRRFMRNFF